MYIISATAPRSVIEAAADALTWLDPSPAEAVDIKEETRVTWRIDAYAMDAELAHGCAGVIEVSTNGLIATVRKLEDKDWVAVSLEGLPAVAAGPFIVAGAHELAKGHPGRIPLWIEAGPAFGTGHHGTTAGCLIALENLARRKPLGHVLDVGTGSGVLAIAAIKRGAISAVASDMDADSIRVARVNGQNNKVGRTIKFLVAMGTHSALIQSAAPYDTILANILARPLVGLSGDFAKVLKPAGSVILSGLLNHQEPSVRAAFAGRGLVLKDRLHKDGWSTLTYYKPKAAAPAEKLLQSGDVRPLETAIKAGNRKLAGDFDDE